MSTQRAAQQLRWRGHAVYAVLFDLDGTLLDTVEDITLALNRALTEAHLATLTTGQVRHLIGRGVPTLIARAARLPVICVPYGYNEGSDPRALPCDAFIETVADLPALLLGEAPALHSLTQPA